MSRNGRLAQLKSGQRDKMANFVTLSRCAEHFYLTGEKKHCQRHNSHSGVKANSADTHSMKANELLSNYS